MTDVRASFGPAIGATLFTALVVWASFMTWGTFVVELENPMGQMFAGLIDDPDVPVGIPGMTGTMTMTVVMTGWSGSITLVEGLDLPDWTVAAVSFVLAVLAWLRVLGTWSAPRLLELALGTLAAAMLVVFLAAVLTADSGTAGPGAWIALAGIAGGSLAVRNARSPGEAAEG